MFKMTILAENYARKRFMVAEHGLSIYIEKDNKNILFDTGQSSIFSHNAKQSGIDLAKVDNLIFSHGHYDHTGGINKFLKVNKTATIYVHPDAFNKRYFGKEQNDIGIPYQFDKYENLINCSSKLVKNKETIYIDENIIVSGEIKITDDSEISKNFYTDIGCNKLVKDNFIDEQILLIKEKEGVYIFTGCCHVGLINCINYVKELLPGQKIAGIIGGMHLEKYSDEKLTKVIDYIGINRIDLYTLHCTKVYFNM